MKCLIIDSCFNCYTSEMEMCNSSQFKKCSVYLKEILEGKNMNQSTNEECKHKWWKPKHGHKTFCEKCGIMKPKDSEEEYIYCTKQDYINENKKFVRIIEFGLELLEKEEFGQLSYSGSFYKDMKKILDEYNE